MNIVERYTTRLISFGILLLKVLTIDENLLIINQRKEERIEMTYKCLDYKT